MPETRFSQCIPSDIIPIAFNSLISLSFLLILSHLCNVKISQQIFVEWIDRVDEQYAIDTTKKCALNTSAHEQSSSILLKDRCVLLWFELAHSTDMVKLTLNRRRGFGFIITFNTHYRQHSRLVNTRESYTLCAATWTVCSRLDWIVWVFTYTQSCCV